MQHTFIQRARPIAAAAMVGLGILIFNENLYHAATRLAHLGTNSGGAGGALFTAILAAGQLCQSCAADHHRFLRNSILNLWVACWPLLLVLAGNVLSQDAVTDNTKYFPKKGCVRVDQRTRHSTLK